MKLPELNGFQLEVSDRLIYALVGFGILVCVYVLVAETQNAKRNGKQSQVKRPCGCKEQPREPLGVSADDER